MHSDSTLLSSRQERSHWRCCCCCFLAHAQRTRSQAATGALSALAKHQFSGILQTESDLELSMFWQEQH